MATHAADNATTIERVDTGEALRMQWTKPKEILAVLLIVGGDIVQKALAQFAGGLVPVAFSFGWVAYSFSTIVSLVGDGRLMPEPDYGCKVINLDSGYVRENKSWLIGRMLRDDETLVNDEGLQVTVYEGKSSGTARYRIGAPYLSKSWAIGLLVIVTQLVIALIPYVQQSDWRILAITGVGTFLSLITSSLPQWRAEKFACRKKSDKRIAITVGNGSRHVMIIKGLGDCLDLEDLACAESPRLQRPWERYGYFVTRPKTTNQQATQLSTPLEETAQSTSHDNNTPSTYASGRRIRTTRSRNQDEIESQPQRKITAEDHGIEQREIKKKKWPEKAIVHIWGKTPIDFYITQAVCLILALCWIALLISVGGLEENTWFMFIVGGIGSLHNAYVAGVPMSPESAGFGLRGLYSVTGVKAMDVLMDLEIQDPGMGRPLRDIFFPGDVGEERGEVKLWNEQIPKLIQKRLNAGHYDRLTVDRLEKMGFVQHLPRAIGGGQPVSNKAIKDYIASRDKDEARSINGVKMCEPGS